MRDLAIFCDDTRDATQKKGAKSGNFGNERERDFPFLLGWDAVIVRER